MRFASNLDRQFYRLERDEVWQKQNHRCFYCKEILTKNEVTADHVEPLSKVKHHIKSNIVAACAKCNSNKSNMSLEEFTKTNVNQQPKELQDFFRKLEERVRKAEFNLDITTHFTTFRHWQTYWDKRGKWNKIIKKKK